MKTIIALLCAILISSTSYAGTFVGKYSSSVAMSKKQFERETKQIYIYHCENRCTSFVLLITITDGIHSKVVWTSNTDDINLDKYHKSYSKWVTTTVEYDNNNQIISILNDSTNYLDKKYVKEIDWNHVIDITQKSIDTHKGE